MRFQLMFIIVLFLWNCEDKQTSKNSNTTVVKDTITKEKPTQKKKAKKTSKFPVLSDDNAMEFFLEYDKEHKENKVRLTTDFGDIDLLLYDKTKFHRSNFIYLTKRKYSVVQPNKCVSSYAKTARRWQQRFLWSQSLPK